MMRIICGKKKKKKLPLAGIASERAHGPERGGGVHPGGLRGFAHLGLHVGVDLRGRRRQLSACHGSLSAKPPPPLSAATEIVSLFALLVKAHGETPAHETRIPRLTDAADADAVAAAAAQRAERRQREAPCGITGSSDTLRRAAAGLQLSQRSSIPAGGDGRSPRCVADIHASSRCNVKALRHNPEVIA